MAEWCGVPDEGQWAPVAGDPTQLPAAPAPVVAEPVPEDAIEIEDEDWDPCANFWITFPVDQDPVFEETLTPVQLLPPYLERLFLTGETLHAGMMRVLDYSVVPVVTPLVGTIEHTGIAGDPLVGATEHMGIAGDPLTTSPPEFEILDATYGQSSVYSSNTAATAEGMTNGVFAESTQTGTNSDNGFDNRDWLQMDLGSEVAFEKVVVGADFGNTLAGGWGKFYAENCSIRASNVGGNNPADWTTLVASTGTFSQGIQDYATPGASYRYVRLVGLEFDYLAVTEFYAIGVGVGVGPPPVVEIPAAAVGVAALAPTVTGGTISVVLIPVAAITVEAPAFTVQGATIVQIPAAAVTVAALAPEVVGDTPPALLLHMEDGDGSTSIADSSGNNLTLTTASASFSRVRTAQSKFGGGALFLTASGTAAQSYASRSYSAALNVGSGDFTIDCWVRPSTTGSATQYIARLMHSAGFSRGGWYMAINASGYLFGGYGDGTNIVGGIANVTAALVTNDAWQHVAFVRNGSDLSFYLDGTKYLVVDNASAAPAAANSTFMLGNDPGNTTRCLDGGYIDEFRVVPGVAVWTANFTPPTAPYADP